jgi:hypothetical protein
MTRYIASITQDMNWNSRRPRSWTINIGREDAQYTWTRETGRFFQDGPVHNGIRGDHGCFESRRDALAEALNLIAVPCVIREDDDGYLTVGSHGDRRRGRVVASRSAKGDYFAA